MTNRKGEKERHFYSSLSEIVYQWMEPVNRKEEKAEQRRENKQWSFSHTSRNWHTGLCENPWCAFHWIQSKSNSCIAVNRQWRRYRQEWSHPSTNIHISSAIWNIWSTCSSIKDTFVVMCSLSQYYKLPCFLDRQLPSKGLLWNVTTTDLVL